MERDIVKEKLRKTRRLYLEIEAKKRQRVAMQYMALGSSAQIQPVKVQTSLGEGSMSASVVELVDLDRAIEEDIKRLCRLQDEGAELIRKISKTEHRAIMTDYYLNAYNWDQVAELNGYSIQAVFKMHGLALKELREKVE